MEIQQDEIEALRSIYMEDFEEEEIRTGAWNVGDSIPGISDALLVVIHDWLQFSRAARYSSDCTSFSWQQLSYF